MIGKKINQLATELAPVSTDLTIIGDPTTGVSKKITLAQLAAIFSGAVGFYANFASFPASGDVDIIYCAKNTQKLYLWSGSAYVEVFPSQALLDTYQLRSEKGVSNGYASLDSSGKVPISQLPSSIMEYKGTWNAATNTPTLANGTGDTGDVYICNVAGTVNFGAGPITFAVGDYVIYSGTIWQRSSGAVGTVTSVAASITGNAIGITGSPVTTSGTLAFAFAGTGAQYIKGDGTLATFPSTIAQAERLITEVYNSTGATLTKGTIVYINGGQGNLPTVTKALATGDSTSAQTFGVVQADITNNNNGYVVVAGKLSDLDTQAYTEGTQLYLSATTAGTWTSTKQYAPNHLVYVGIVVRAHPTQGIVEIKIQNGYELDELHDVAAQNPDNNDILQYKTSTSLWTKVAGTTSNIAEGSNLYYTNARSRAALSFTAGSGAYNSTTGVITIPTNTNQLTNGANYITLGSLSASSPLSYNNTTGAFSISQANSTTNGFLSSTDWNTFNSKQAALTFSSPLVNTAGTISIPAATSSVNGYLTSTDWTTFNSKQNALNGTGFVKISGTTISYDNSTYYLASNPNAYIALTNLSAGAGISYNNTTGVIASTITQYTDAMARAAFSETVAGLDYNSTTGVLSLTTGYVIPTTTNETNWNAAYNDKINSAAVTGTTTKTLTLTQQDGGTITASWTDDNTDAVTSVFGRTGAVVATSGDYNTSQVTENTNLYFTNARAIASTLTGYTSGAGTISATDTILSAIQKLNGNIGALTTGVSSVNGLTGAVTLTTSNIAEGTNLYYTEARVNANTNVAANTAARHNAVTIGTANGLSLSTQVLSLALASGSTTGALSSTDWTTFNNKQSALTNPVTGTGTTNYLPKFTGTSTIGNSIIYDNGTNVGIGVASNLFAKLTVNGGLSIGNGWGTSGATLEASTGAAGTDGATIEVSYWGTSSYGSLFLKTGNAIRATLNASGNLGLGVNPSASTYKNFQINTTGILGSASGYIWLGNNWVYNSGDKYIANGTSQLFGLNDGGFQWFTAPSGTAGNAISFTQAMTLNASGNLSIGNTNDTYKLDVSGTGRFTNSVRVQNPSLWGVIELVGSASNQGGQVDFYGSTVRYGTIVGEYESAGNGKITLRTWTGSGTTPVSALVLASTGAATFSSSVTANGNNITIQPTTTTTYALSVMQNAGGYLRVGRDTSTGALYGDAYAGLVVSSGAYPLILGTNDTERMRITSGGALLVGDTSNASGSPTFYVKNKNGAVANIAGWNFGGTTTADNGNNNLLSSGGYYSGSTFIATQTTATTYQQYGGDHIFYTNAGLTAGNAYTSSERMRITSGGTVAIGTTGRGWNASYRALEIGSGWGMMAHASNSDGYICSNTYYDNNWRISAQTNIKPSVLRVYDGFLFQSGSTNSIGSVTTLTDLMTITSSGNVEIATGSIKTGEPDTGYGRAAFKIGSRQTGEATSSGGYIPISIDGTVYFINLYTSTP